MAYALILVLSVVINPFINSKNILMPNSKTSTATARPRKGAESHLEMQLEHPFGKFFVDSLRDIYWAEKHLTKALPKMQKAATSQKLQGAFADHLTQTEEHVTRLEQVFEELGEKPRAKKCEGMEGLIKEGEKAIEETEKGSMTRDAALIISAQKIEHYEIAAYGSLAQLAHTMGLDATANTLGRTLDEEKDTDKVLTEIAENDINWEAEQEGDASEEE
jgi:ferritin-like metal-binding protein YciE